MGQMFVSSASQAVSVGPGQLTSILASPPASPGVSAHITLYDATAATAGSEIFFIHLGTAAPRPINWSDPKGYRFSNLWCAANSSACTLVWD